MPVPVILSLRCIRGVSFICLLCGWKKEKIMAFIIELLLIGVGLSMDAFAVFRSGALPCAR